jgi:protein tyrosine/serine phosphatase
MGSCKAAFFLICTITFSGIFAGAYEVQTDSSVDAKTIPQFNSVTSDIFRGGRPSDDDMASLKANQHIRLVINVEDQAAAVAHEQSVAQNLGMDYFASAMTWYITPTDAQVNEILAKLQDPKNFPIYLHCLHGQDRTGMIIGIYRVEVQGWTPEKAYQEMLDMGFRKVLKPLDNYFRNRTGYRGP